MATDNTVEQLDAYYSLNLHHLKYTFWASLGALFAGLITLLGEIFIVMQGNIGLSAQLSVIGGVLTEFIGAGFFVLYGKNLDTVVTRYWPRERCIGYGRRRE